MVRLVMGTSEVELLSNVQARCDDPQDPAPDADWQTEARVAADYGLLVLAGAGAEQSVARTKFGDTWAESFGCSDPLSGAGAAWPLPGPGKFDVHFFPLPARPPFPLFALTGPAVDAVRQGGWNLERGLGKAGLNPITQVEMRSTLHNGTWVTVLAETGDRVWISGLRLAENSRYEQISKRLLAAIADRATPWEVRALDVDGERRDILVLNLFSDDLPAGVTGPGLLAVTQIDDAQVTIIGEDPNTELRLSTIDPADLVAPRPRGESA